MKDPNYSVCKIFRHSDKISDYLSDNIKGPISVELHISNRCNFDCMWCEPNLFGRNRKDEMSKTRLLRLVDEFKSCAVRGVLLSGGGEPLLHPNVSDFINKCSDNNISTGLFTNGSLISDENILSLLKCDFVRISFDAGIKQNYNRLHGSPVFESVVENIRKLVKKRNELKYKADKILYHPNTTIGTSYVISKENCSMEEIEKYIILMEDIGVDYVQLRPVRNKNVLSMNTLRIIQTYLKRIQTRNNLNVKIIYNPHYNTAYKMPKRTYSKCHMNNFQVVISPTGDMFPCYGFIHRGDKCMGNIGEDFCKAWKNRKLNVICKTECVECRFHLQNKMLEDLKNITHKNFM